MASSIIVGDTLANLSGYPSARIKTTVPLEALLIAVLTAS
jgi:hypothetical protein